jgi:hypothetical protein
MPAIHSKPRSIHGDHRQPNLPTVNTRTPQQITKLQVPESGSCPKQVSDSFVERPLAESLHRTERNLFVRRERLSRDQL